MLTRDTLPLPTLRNFAPASEFVPEPNALGIDLAHVQRVSLDLTANTLAVEYTGEADIQLFAFPAPEVADSSFAELSHRLGIGFQVAPDGPDTRAAIRGPLTLLFCSLLLTAMFALAWNVLEDTASLRAAGMGQNRTAITLLESLFGLLDLRLVCVVGGAMAAMSQIWLYRRLTTPPTKLELVRSSPDAA